MTLIQNMSDSLFTGFIDGNTVSLEEYQPRLLINDSKRGRKVLTSLIGELCKCDEFFFSVAFITNSGVAALINTLKELENNGIKGKIIASQYQNFTEPRALNRLAALKNIQLKIVTEGNFHAKGYIFKKRETYSLIIGSSNLTQNALSVNKEWNIKVSSSDSGSLILNTLDEFNKTFINATTVDETWIKEYTKIYDDSRRLSRINAGTSGLPENDINIININRIIPNRMQANALIAIENLRAEDKNKALLISATGTGKTFLAAFDAKKINPKRLLFVIHRENIARAAMKSFKTIFGKSKNMGLLCGNSKAKNVEYVFSTIQTLSKENTLKNYPSDYFDYIIIDEVHRSGGETYKKIIEHFRPKFMLGMTATPERTDGYDIFKAFDYNIAYEIRLNQALEENMLVPFHYFGVSDIEIDGVLLNENTDFNKLVCNERIEKIKHFSRFYGCDNGRIKGLIFCSRKEEAKILSIEFNKIGYHTIALDGDSSENLREESIQRLEQEEEINSLDYIFTIDIFNEGVDIPKVNQIIMLRPTQSAIIFVQQLGRGLRLSYGKEYLTVIDFIGNYANNYLVPIALYGDNSYNKDNIRKLINSGSSFIPGASTINFDLITKQRIFDAIDQTNLSSKKEMVKDYQLLKYKLGKIPDMIDFIEHGSRDPFAYVENAGSYYSFISSLETSIMGRITTKDIKLLEFYSKECCNAKRVEESILLKELIEKGVISKDDFLKTIQTQYEYIPSLKTINSIVAYLNGEFFKPQEQEKYNVKESVIFRDDLLEISSHLNGVLQNDCFKHYLLDAIQYSINKFTSLYSSERYFNGFSIYQKYSRKDACRILNWEKDEASTIYGYRIKYNTCPIFVTYKKMDSISDSTKYEDHFIDKNHFSWMTRNKITLDSSEVINIKNFKTSGIRISLFVKKSDGEGSDFYYMGDMEPYNYEQKTINNKNGVKLPIVCINYKMNFPVDDNMYNYLES
ncbi:MAG: DUF3427 domain-containing protein [Saccharofermentanales bacterium]